MPVSELLDLLEVSLLHGDGSTGVQRDGPATLLAAARSRGRAAAPPTSPPRQSRTAQPRRHTRQHQGPDLAADANSGSYAVDAA